MSAPKHNRLIAGFDAGQTHTTCRLAWLQPEGDWQRLGEAEGPGVSHLAAADGPRRFSDALNHSLSAARRICGVSDSTPLSAAGVGASGIEAESAVQRQGEQLAATALNLPAQQVAVVGDERTALAGAFHGQAGILVISGTGCIAVGSDGRGRLHRCGGWGWLLDGAGSAMDIGRDGLALSVRMADGRVAETPLRAALWQALGAATAQDVKAAVVAPGFGPAAFARLAPLVAQAAEAGDREAAAVVQRSALALAELVAGVSQALSLEAPAVCAVGGAVEHLRPLRSGLESALAAQVPGARLQQPQGDACDGALALAAVLPALSLR